MKRRALALLAFLALPLAAQSGPEPGTGGGSGAGGTGDVVGPSSSTDNWLVRFDTTTGKLVQGSGVTLSDAGATNTFLADSPAVPTNGTTAGNALALTASPAIPNAGAGTDGAAAGGAITFTAGAAARDTSGNADAGVYTFTESTGIGTGRASFISIPNGGATVPGLAFANSATTGLFSRAATAIGIASGGARVECSSSVCSMTNSTPLNFATTATAASGNVGFTLSGTNQLTVTNGWLQQTPGRISLTSDYTNATATMSNTALSITVVSGRKYSFEAALFLSDSTAAEGVQIDFSGGAATSTYFIAHCRLTSDVGAATVQTNAASAALATVINAPVLGSVNIHEYACDGAFVPSSSSTFIVRAAQNTHATGTLTIKRGSWLNFEDQP